jgi:hypothetical protein
MRVVGILAYGCAVVEMPRRNLLYDIVAHPRFPRLIRPQPLGQRSGRFKSGNLALSFEPDGNNFYLAAGDLFTTLMKTN